jgi:hypothetical protein
MTDGHSRQGRRRAGRKTKPKTLSRRRRIVLWSMAGLATVIVFCVGWVGVRGVMAKGELEEVVPLAGQLKQSALNNDTAAVSRTASELHQHALKARDLTGDPIWRLAEVLPVIGTNLTAARELASSVNDLSNNAVGPLTRLVSSVALSDFKPVNGAIDLEPLLESQSAVTQAAAALAQADDNVSRIDTRQTIGPVTAAVERLHSQIKELLPPVTALSNAVKLAPSMLGEGEPRNYLLIFQNPAELRSTGGIPGAMALMHTDDGKIELQQQSSSSEFPHYESPVIELPEETRGLYGDLVGEFIQDVTLTPNFDLSARIAQQMWKERYGTQVDGVISVDPVALSYLLEATGPVGIATGDQLSSDNVVSLLLNEAYIRYPKPAQQDAFFAASAKAVFDKVAGGDVDPSKLIAGLARAGDERRILVWNDRDDEQAVLAGTTLAGEMVGETETSPQVGMFLNDATGSKMDYYLDVKTSVGTVSCRQDGMQNVAIEVSITNTAPADAGTSLPAYITGDGTYGVTPGNIRTMLTAYGAPGMVNLGVSQGGQAVAAHSAADTGRPVSQVSAELAPGQSASYTFAFLAKSGSIGPDDLQLTPFINMNETSELSLTCESALW